jgi:ABC-type uncharacterized transport system permease subunit
VSVPAELLATLPYLLTIIVLVVWGSATCAAGSARQPPSASPS